MTNINYQKERDKEYRLRAKYLRAGKLCFRLAESNPLAHLVVIDKESRLIKFIQIKPKKFSEKQKRKLLIEYGWLDDEFLVEFAVE